MKKPVNCVEGNASRSRFSSVGNAIHLTFPISSPSQMYLIYKPHCAVADNAMHRKVNRVCINPAAFILLPFSSCV